MTEEHPLHYVAIPAPPGLVATYTPMVAEEVIDPDPVVAFDRDGFALVLNHDGGYLERVTAVGNFNRLEWTK